MDQDTIKRAVGIKAAQLVLPGMKVGLGTGSTAFYFIEALIERCRQGLKIEAMASSERSLQQAMKGGIPLLDPHKVSSLDLTVDGADEVDPEKRMVKGRGGALVREKIVANMSKEVIIIIDEGKLVPCLGQGRVPIEVIPFGIAATLKQLEKGGFHPHIRQNSDHSPYITDNGNMICDLQFQSPTEHPEQDHERLIHIPGVVDTGFFFHLSGKIIVGFQDGQVVIR